MLVIETTVNWYKYGKIKNIALEYACGLLAGIDLPIFNTWLRHYTERYDNGRIKLVDANHEQLVKLESIIAVTENHIASNSFIKIEIKRVADSELQTFYPHEKIPKGKFAGIRVVDLAEFGTWAKSAGYDLPPEFPIADNPTELNINSPTTEEPVPELYKPESQKLWMKWVIENKGLDEYGKVKPRFRAGFLREGKEGFSQGTLAKLYDSVIQDYKS